jgi:predicted Zn-ribbon and HTH transcriptional regulator
MQDQSETLCRDCGFRGRTWLFRVTKKSKSRLCPKCLSDKTDAKPQRFGTRQRADDLISASLTT